jgi:hypothetical protein
MIEGSTFISTADFARFGVPISLGTKEPHRVSSNTEFTYIPTRSTTADQSANEDDDVGKTTVTSSPSAIYFDILERKSRPSLRRALTLTLNRAASTEAFVAMKDVFFDKKISVKSQAIVYADSSEHRSMEYDSWAFKATHIAKFVTFNHKCVQWLVTV